MTLLDLLPPRRTATASAHVDEAAFRDRARRCRKKLPGTKVVYAGNPLTTEVARWSAEEHLGIEISCTGDLTTALAGGVAPTRLVFRGGTRDALAAAVEVGAGRIVVDSTTQIDQLAGLARRPQHVLVCGADLVAALVEQPLLRLSGVYGTDVRELICTMADARRAHGVVLGELTVSSGALPTRQALDDALDECCAAERFPRPTVVVVLDPG